MQNRAKFSVLPIAEIYARKTLGLDWPAGATSLRANHSQLVSPLMSYEDAEHLCNQLKYKDAINAGLISAEDAEAICNKLRNKLQLYNDFANERLITAKQAQEDYIKFKRSNDIINTNVFVCAQSRFKRSNEKIRFRVVINLSELTSTHDEFDKFITSLNERERLQLLATHLNYVHAPFGEKFWGIGKLNGLQHLCYLAPSRSYTLVRMCDEQGNTVFDENHDGWEYENALRYAFSNLAKINGFDPAMQTAFRANMIIKDAFRKSYYYFNPDFIPILLNMLSETLSVPHLRHNSSIHEAAAPLVAIPGASAPLRATRPTDDLTAPARFFHRAARGAAHRQPSQVNLDQEIDHELDSNLPNKDRSNNCSIF